MLMRGGWWTPEADDYMWKELEDGHYQQAQLDAALRHVTDWSIAVDGGAHVGTWSKRLAARFQRVVSFEASPDTFEAFAANMQMFGCTNVEPINAALGCDPTLRVGMILDPNNIEKKNTGGRRVLIGGGNVPVQTVDSLNLPSLGLLKLDVEGSEPWALQGAARTIKFHRPTILYEDKKLWLRYGLPKDAVTSMLKKWGYHQVEKVRRDEIWIAA